jgi:hypothetical protein
MTKASIPNVLGNCLELPNGNVVEVGCPSWFNWLDNSDFRSFRFEDGISPYTCRKEKVKGHDGYWYGYQRVNGKVTKRYIGRSVDLSHDKLKEISTRFEALPKKVGKNLGNIEVGKKLPNQIGNSSSDSLGELEAELAQLRADNEQLKQELADCQQELARCQGLCTQSQQAAEPAQVLNQLRKQNKRTKVMLRDVEDIMSLLSVNE